MNDFPVQRIIIACDAVSENRAGIEAAARLAGIWNALLHAVFLQDEGLLNLAALPFARQVGAAGAEKLDEMAIQDQFEADAERVRSALEAAARSRSLVSSFAVVRGRPTLATLAVGDRDLLVIMASARPFAGRFRMASRWLLTALEANLPVLLLRNHSDWAGGIVCAMQSDAPSSWRALAAAARFAVAADRPLIVRIVGNAVTAGEIRERLSGISPDLGHQPPIENLGRGQAPDAGENSLLVIDAAPEVNDRAALKTFVERVRADILFVR